MTRVKICGITNLEDALAASQAGADLLGFIFYEPSPRYVTPDTVREIVDMIKRHSSSQREQEPDPVSSASNNSQAPLCVGVFVNAALATIDEIFQVCRLDAVQLHGEEPPELVHHFQNRGFKALRPQSPAEAEILIRKYRGDSRPRYQPVNASPYPYFLLDAYHPLLYGGTGQVTDWSIAAGIARRYPVMLAGSLTPANVAEAVQVVNPWAVDVSSGVEKEKGRKDHDKVRAFIEKAKSVQQEIEVM